MSRYVDLDGLTWDGNKITSKIQEVKTKHGYMMGITVGWLWGDNVPHIDLETYEEHIRAKVLDEVIETLGNDYWNIAKIEQLKGEKITNREKLFKVLEKMDNKQLSETVDFWCKDCPANEFCSHTKYDLKTCQETRCEWLNKKQ